MSGLIYCLWSAQFFHWLWLLSIHIQFQTAVWGVKQNIVWSDLVDMHANAASLFFTINLVDCELLALTTAMFLKGPLMLCCEKYWLWHSCWFAFDLLIKFFLTFTRRGEGICLLLTSFTAIDIAPLLQLVIWRCKMNLSTWPMTLFSFHRM